MAITAPQGPGRGRNRKDDDCSAEDDVGPSGNTKKAAGLPKDTRTRAEYTLGKIAFEAGKSEDDCPYPEGGERISWFTGYFDTRTATKLAGVFERNNITWP